MKLKVFFLSVALLEGRSMYAQDTRDSGRVDKSLPARTLKAVTVTARVAPVVVKKDTLVFNAGAFLMRPYATLEDLLKRLPGLEVDKDGNVTLQGKPVDKIYLDGKEFFLGDLKNATRNLPSEIVAQIEAFDTQTDHGKLIGISEKTGGKTFNIKLKEDRKQGYFGKIFAGTGNEKAYTAGETATRLNGERMIQVNSGINNINNQFNGTENPSDLSSGGRQSSSSASIVYRNDRDPKLIKLIDAEETGGTATLLQTSIRQSFLSDSSLLENRSDQVHTQTIGYLVNSVLTFRPAPTTSVILRSMVKPLHSSGQSIDTVSISTQLPSRSYLSSHGSTNNSNTSSDLSLLNELSISHRLHKQGRSISVGFTQSSDDQHQNSSLYSNVNDSITNQQARQTSGSSGQNYFLEYTEPLAPDKLLELTYLLDNNINRNDKQSLDLDGVTGRYDRPDSLTSNHFASRNTIHSIGAIYSFGEGKLRYRLNLKAQITDIDNNNYSIKTRLHQHYFNWTPDVSILYTLSPFNDLSLTYSGRSSNPTIDQLQPIPDLTNPFFVRIGNPGLLQQFDHSGDISFAHSTSHSSLHFGFHLNLTEHPISSATTILPGGIQQMQYVNVKNIYHQTGQVSYSITMSPQAGNIRIEFHDQLGHNLSLLNGQLNITSSLGLGGKIQWYLQPMKELSLDLLASLDATSNRYSQSPAQNTRSWVSNNRLDITYEMPGQVTVHSDYNLQVNGQEAMLPALNVVRWNAAVYKMVIQKLGIQVRLSAFDILNSNKGYTRGMDLNTISTNRTNVPGRLLLLSVIFNFKSFEAAEKIEKKSS